MSDAGPGISAERPTALFSPFHTLHQTTRAKGLGLPIVERLVALHGGRCSYEPAPSTFSFELPAVS